VVVGGPVGETYRGKNGYPIDVEINADQVGTNSTAS
jgi:hypothetical protein